MSIIYDALKKVEKSGEPALKDNKVAPAPKNKIRNYLIYILFLALGLFASRMFFTYLNRQPPKVKPAKQTNTPKPPPPPQQTQPLPAVVNTEAPAKPTLILNGIFSSGEESYALINNQIVKLGDKISGAVIKKIAPEEVLLDFEGSEIRLTTNH